VICEAKSPSPGFPLPDGLKDHTTIKNRKAK